MMIRPPPGPRYWCGLCAASVFGANTGDVFSRLLGLGYWHGLPVLAALFAVVIVAQRQRRQAEAWYWIAIILVRTAATNLADLTTLDLGVPFPLVIGCLAIVLAVLAASDRRTLVAPGVPAADGVFWVTMLVAGTLGTAVGDDLAFVQQLQPPAASAVMTLVLVGSLAAARPSLGARSAAAYWLTVLVVRTWGTNVGDFAADTLGLAASTLISGIVLAALLALWRPRVRAIARPAAQADAG